LIGKDIDSDNFIQLKCEVRYPFFLLDVNMETSIFFPSLILSYKRIIEIYFHDVPPIHLHT